MYTEKVNLLYHIASVLLSSDPDMESRRSGAGEKRPQSTDGDLTFQSMYQNVRDRVHSSK